MWLQFIVLEWRYLFMSLASMCIRLMACIFPSCNVFASLRDQKYLYLKKWVQNYSSNTESGKDKQTKEEIKKGNTIFFFLTQGLHFLWKSKSSSYCSNLRWEGKFLHIYITEIEVIDQFILGCTWQHLANLVITMHNLRRQLDHSVHSWPNI